MDEAILWGGNGHACESRAACTRVRIRHPGMVNPASAISHSHRAAHARARAVVPAHPQARLFTTAGSAVAQIVGDVDRARSSVDAEFFALMPDGPGATLAASLIRAARRGVRVRLVLSGVGNVLVGIGAGRSFTAVESMRMIRAMQAAGIDVVMQWPWSGTPEARPTNHRKAVAIDGSVAYVGGMNFGKSMEGWADAMVRLTGQPGRTVSHEQDGRLAMYTMQPTTRRRLPALHVFGSYTLLSNDPAGRNFAITDWYLDRINHARRRIVVASPTLLDRELAAALRAAAARGVEVRVILPGVNPSGLPGLNMLTRAVASSVADAGASVLEMQGFTHTKAMLVDDEATVGSFNLTDRSSSHDQELNIASSDPAFVRQVESMLQGLASRSRQRSLDSPFHRVMSHLVPALGIEY